jgi:hypothetical protein
MIYKCFEPPPYLHAFNYLLSKHSNLFWCMPCYCQLYIHDPLLLAWLAMLSIYCCNSGIWVWSLYESGMIVCCGNCGELVKLDNRPGWASTWVVVIWLILAALGPNFLYLDSRWAYNRTWRNGTPVDWLTFLDLSMSYLVWDFHLAYAWVCKIFAKRCINIVTWTRLLEVDSSDKPISTHNKWFRIGERPSLMADLGLLAWLME